MVTLDNLHSHRIDEIKNFNLEEEMKKLEVLKKKKEKLSNSDIDASKWLELLGDIKKCETKIQEFKSDKALHDYYLQAGDVLFQYYDTIQNVDKEKNQKNVEIRKDSILSYLSTSNTEDNNLLDSSQIENNKDHYSDSEDEDDEYVFDKYISREELRAEYLIRMNENDKKIKKSSHKFKVKNDICQECNAELTHIQSESVIECTKCGHLTNIIIDTEKTSYKEPPKESCYYSYRRSNHFNEWIAQFQGKETTQIPRQVLQQVVFEIKKERIQDLSKLSNQKVRSILKKLKMNKYYEHIPYIINLLNGKDPPHMTRQQEEKLRIMFQQIQGPFLEFCPKKRKNFLSYSYVLNKFVGLLGLDHLQSLFPLLKSREKLHSQGAIWKQICDKIGWEFHKSI